MRAFLTHSQTLVETNAQGGGGVGFEHDDVVTHIVSVPKGTDRAKVNPDYPTRTSPRLDPETAWTVLTEAPLKGLGLAREAGSIFVWDETDRLYLLDLNGEFRSVTRASGKIVAAAVSDDGSRIVLLGEGSRLWLLDADLGVVAERQGPPEPLAVAIDPHGRYVVVSSKMSVSHFYTRFGKPAGRFETLQPLAFMTFVPGSPLLVAAASYGMMIMLDLSERGGGRLGADVDWNDRQVSGVGRLTTTGDGAMILASCFTHGVQRYDIHGHNDGSYHLGGTATQAVPDFAGRMFAVATLEGEIAVLNSAGNVRWRTGLPRPAIALETDPLGRFLIYGQATGEIVRLDLYATGSEPAKARTVSAPAPFSARDAPGTARGASATIRKPDWMLPVVANDDAAETAVLTVLDEPSRVAVFTSSLRLQIVATDGQNLGFAPEITGTGRILRTAPGWIAAATDRQIVLYHAVRNAAQRVDLSLVEVTHLAIRPDSYGLAVVQERDRIGRATVAGRWIWKQELKAAVEDIAIGPDGYTAVSNDAGVLSILDPAGVTVGTYQAGGVETLSLIDAVEGAPQEVVWMTLSRTAQVLRGHDLRSKVLWESPVAWEGWQFQRLGPIATVSAPDGRVLAFDGSGHLRGQGKAAEGGKFLLAATPLGEPRRVSRQGVHLMCSDLDGRVRWRCVCEEPLGPIAVGRNGVAAVIGRSLAWFQGLD
jgi:hypothetical protein